jgi:hypothetical protein
MTVGRDFGQYGYRYLIHDRDDIFARRRRPPNREEYGGNLA